MFTNKLIFPHLNLQLFAEGGAGGDGGTSGEGANGVGAGVPSLQKGSKNPLADVRYGKQEEEVSVTDSQTSIPAKQTIAPEDRVSKFEELIKGEYKDLYDQRVQDVIQKRLKGSKEIVDKYNALNPTLELLGKKYGVNPSDVEALNKAIEEDDSYYEEEALEKGVSVEQLKEIKKMERENAELKRQMNERQQQQQAEKDVALWMQQAEEAKASFPMLDLGEELKNPQFINLLKSGVDVGTAYFAMHHKEIIPQAMQYTAKKVEQKLVNNIMAGNGRPAENGVNSNASAVVKSDVSQLSKADRQEIIRRVQRGEKISF